MKKIALCLMASCMLLTFQPYHSNAANDATATSAVAPKPSESSEAKTLLLRLDEINAMDKSELKWSEKRSLRKEVRSINKELRVMQDGVYLSVGAVIIIVLLLVILV